jgi:hypothetical protein
MSTDPLAALAAARRERSARRPAFAGGEWLMLAGKCWLG